jgi:glycosyltransferase involved in cell wall biosynthesis
MATIVNGEPARMDRRLSVVIPWYNRPELSDTLAKNLPIYDSADAEVLIVNCGGDPEGLLAMTQRASARVRQLDVPARFSKSLALNLGIHFAESTHIFVLDADVVLLPGTFAGAMTALDVGCFVTLQTVHESDNRPPAWARGLTAAPHVFTIVRNMTTEVRWSDGSSTTIEDFRIDILNCNRCAAGLILARKDDFVAVGGYRSVLDGWGWEDNDMMIRLNRVLGLKRRQAGEAVHLTHADDVRDLNGKDKIASTESNFDRVCSYYIRGELQGTYAADVSEWSGKVVERRGAAAGRPS